MKRVYSLVAMLLAVGTTWGQLSTATITALDGVEGSGLYIYAGPITFQQVFAPSQLPGLPIGAMITGMQLRLDSSWLTSPASTIPNFNVSMGPSNFAPDSLTNSVTANQGPGTVQVRSGPLTFDAGSFPTGGSPNGFGPLIAFTTPYTYTGGNLLLTVSHSTPSSELDFDVGHRLNGVQIFQAQDFGTDTLTENSPDSSLAVQFSFGFASVPEPAAYYSAAMSLMLGGVLLHRRYRARQLAKEKS
jgi:hypothetical protein